MNSFLEIHPEVQLALQEGRPVVALESTIISHGMPYPQNVETALAVEQVVRDGGAVPATIAIMNGKCYVGLTAHQIELFGKARDVWKVSLRDIPYVLTQNKAGATTVAATMRIASMAGIAVFVTGGIGGEISAWICEHCFELLDAPVLRCASLDTPIPFNIDLEKNFMANSRLDHYINKLIQY